MNAAAGLAVLILLLGVPGFAAIGEASPIEIRLIAFNDFHGYIEPSEGPLPAPDPRHPGQFVKLATGGAAYLTTLVRQLAVGHPLHAVVAAGDLVGASPFASALFHDEPSILALNALGLELSSVGNHEFDHGAGELRRLQSGGCAPGGERGRDTCVGGNFPGARFHYLAANVIDRTTGKPLFPAYEVKRFPSASGRAIKIGFIGLVLRQAADMVTPTGVAGLEFRDEAASANAQLPALKAQGVDAVVLLIHQGGESSGGFDDHACPDFSGAILRILNGLDPAIRVVVSGHTHQAYVCELGGRLVTSAGSYGRLATAIDLGFDPADGRLVAMHADNFPAVNDRGTAVESYPPLKPAADVAALLEPYARIAAPQAARVIGRISADLTRQPNAAGESALGDLIADTMLEAGREAGAVLAFTNSGGIREDLLRSGDGSLSFAQLAAVLPFGNRLIAMDLSGAQLAALLAQHRFAPTPKPLQVSRGFSYVWSDGGVAGDSLKLDGAAVDGGKTYRIVVSSFLADGGDGFRVFKDARNRREIGGDLDAALAYFAAHSPVAPGPKDRIRRR